MWVMHIISILEDHDFVNLLHLGRKDWRMSTYLNWSWTFFSCKELWERITKWLKWLPGIIVWIHIETKHLNLENKKDILLSLGGTTYIDLLAMKRYDIWRLHPPTRIKLMTMTMTMTMATMTTMYIYIYIYHSEFTQNLFPWHQSHFIKHCTYIFGSISQRIDASITVHQPFREDRDIWHVMWIDVGDRHHW